MIFYDVSAERTCEHLITKHRDSASRFGSRLVDVVKQRETTLFMDAEPCMSEPAVRFWLSQKFKRYLFLRRMVGRILCYTGPRFRGSEVP